MMKKLLYLLLILPLVGISQTNVYSYDFSSPTATMVGTDGWIRTNQSTSASTTALWSVASYAAGTVTATAPATPFQDQAYAVGDAYPIPLGQDGGENGFALVNYASTTSTATSGATISNWLISPVVNVENGDVVTFYTRIGKPSAASFADRLQFRMSTTGANSTAPSTGPTGVGSFTNLLVDVNPNLNLTDYPFVWTQYSYTVTGLNAPTDIKFAFRYFVTNGGTNGSNSDIIGIDTFSVDRPTASAQDFFASNFTLYPNPVKSIINLSSTNGSSIDNVKLTDINGRIVSDTNFSSTQNAEINVANLAAGVYFVKIQSEKGIGTTKIVKN
jgi:hypothetical protein